MTNCKNCGCTIVSFEDPLFENLNGRIWVHDTDNPNSPLMFCDLASDSTVYYAEPDD